MISLWQVSIAQVQISFLIAEPHRSIANVTVMDLTEIGGELSSLAEKDVSKTRLTGKKREKADKQAIADMRDSEQKHAVANSKWKQRLLSVFELPGKMDTETGRRMQRYGERKVRQWAEGESETGREKEISLGRQDRETGTERGRQSERARAREISLGRQDSETGTERERRKDKKRKRTDREERERVRERERELEGEREIERDREIER